MIKKTLIITLLICLFIPQTTIAQDKEHWAAADVRQAKELYGFNVPEQLNEPADVTLQETIIKLAGLSLEPQQNINRYHVLQAMTEQLNITGITEDNTDQILSEYIDICEYCTKVNIVLSKALKSGLAKGRMTPQGKAMAPKDPITNGELVVLYLRYMNR